MKRTIAVLSSILVFFACFSQRSFELVQDSTFWLTSGNAASLTDMKTRSISKAELYYNYSAGKLKSEFQGDKNNIFGAEVKSYSRLTSNLVAMGKISYANNSFSSSAGSMLLPTVELMPFDIVELTDENSGNKRYEQFKVVGAVGWNFYKGLSIGASANFIAGSYAKFKDLRHTNSLMNLEVRPGIFYSFGLQSGFGATFVYHRRTETISFETFGTTDKTFHTLVDYANGFGHVETYGGEGFTDDSNEMPLVSEYLGFALQGGYKSIFADLTWQHRSGYYGKKSQYTACQSLNHGDFFNCCLRYVLPQGRVYLCMFDFSLTSQLLSSYRTNYRKETSNANPSVTYYEYYANTKMSDKASNIVHIDFTGYWKPAGEIYLWHARGGVSYHCLKQTAYLFPNNFTEKQNGILVEATGRRNFIFKNKNLLWASLDVETRLRWNDCISSGIEAGYEIPIKNTPYRPYISLKYMYSSALKTSQYRNFTQITLGITL